MPLYSISWEVTFATYTNGEHLAVYSTYAGMGIVARPFCSFFVDKLVLMIPLSVELFGLFTVSSTMRQAINANPLSIHSYATSMDVLLKKCKFGPIEWLVIVSIGPFRTYNWQNWDDFEHAERNKAGIFANPSRLILWTPLSSSTKNMGLERFLII